MAFTRSICFTCNSQTYLIRTFHFGKRNRVTSTRSDETQIIFSPRRIQTIDADTDLAQSISSLSHLFIHHFTCFFLEKDYQ